MEEKRERVVTIQNKKLGSINRMDKSESETFLLSIDLVGEKFGQ